MPLRSDRGPIRGRAARVGAPSSAVRTDSTSARHMGGASCWSCGQGRPDVLGHALIEVARHLADLHQGALHVAQQRHGLLGRVDLKRRSSCSRRSAEANTRRGPVRCVAGTGAPAESGELPGTFDGANGGEQAVVRPAGHGDRGDADADPGNRRRQTSGPAHAASVPINPTRSRSSISRPPATRA